VKSRARIMLRIAALIEALPVDDQRAVARDVYRTYACALTAAERASRYRDEHRHETVTPAVTKKSRGVRDGASRGIGLGSTGSKNLELTAPATTDQPDVTARHEIVTADFDTFWAAYPRKEAKQTAQSAWRKRKPDLLIVLPALERQKASAPWLKDHGQYIPHPATYINGERWKDELPTNGHRRDVNDPWKGKTEAKEVKL